MGSPDSGGAAPRQHSPNAGVDFPGFVIYEVGDAQLTRLINVFVYGQSEAGFFTARTDGDGAVGETRAVQPHELDQSGAQGGTAAPGGSASGSGSSRLSHHDHEQLIFFAS